MIESERGKQHLTTIGPKEPASEAIRLLKTEPKGGAVLVVESGKLEGIVTNRDVLFLSASELDPQKGLLVKNIMTSHNLVCVPPEATKAQAIEVMKYKKLKRVIMMDAKGKLIDLISAEDLKSWDMTCFVLLPFKEPYLTILNDHIKPILADTFKIRSVKSDDIFRPEAVIETIQKMICASDVIIADITERNPNVYYEVGYSHGVKKKVIFITQDIKNIPFDIAHLRCVIYEYTPRGVKLLEQNLIKAVKATFDDLQLF